MNVRPSRNMDASNSPALTDRAYEGSPSWRTLRRAGSTPAAAERKSQSANFAPAFTADTATKTGRAESDVYRDGGIPGARFVGWIVGSVRRCAVM
jgi:hypothetical protein